MKTAANITFQTETLYARCLTMQCTFSCTQYWLTNHNIIVLRPGSKVCKICQTISFGFIGCLMLYSTRTCVVRLKSGKSSSTHIIGTLESFPKNTFDTHQVIYRPITKVWYTIESALGSIRSTFLCYIFYIPLTKYIIDIQISNSVWRMRA